MILFADHHLLPNQSIELEGKELPNILLVLPLPMTLAGRLRTSLRKVSPDQRVEKLLGAAYRSRKVVIVVVKN